MEYNSIAVGRAALQLAITESRQKEQELRKELQEKGIRSVAVDFGGQFVQSIPKIIEHAVVAAQRQKVVADNHIGEGAVIGLPKKRWNNSNVRPLASMWAVKSALPVIVNTSAWPFM